MTDLHTSLTYDDIVLELIDKFKVKKNKFSWAQFNNFKNRKKEKLNIEYYEEKNYIWHIMMKINKEMNLLDYLKQKISQ